MAAAPDVPLALGPICIRAASWVVAFDAATGTHAYRRDADVVWDGGRIIHLGGRWPGTPARSIDGQGMLVLPGLINIHCHPAQSPLFAGLVEEAGNPRLFQSGRHRFRQAFLPDAEAQHASATLGLAELLESGATTAVDLSHAYPGWLELLAQSGIRAVVAPMFRSAEWFTDTGQETQYRWHADGGRAAFAEACAVMDAAEAHPSGLMSALVSPAQVDTCTPELLQDSAALAARTGRKLHVHAAQSYAEFNGMTRRHGVTPIAYLDRLGFLGQNTILGHAVFTDAHPWTLWPERTDLATLAARGVTVAHCPTVFWRDGTLLHDIGAYLAAGIRMAIGTDTHPQNLLEEMRTAELLGRAAAGPRHACDTARVFHAATIAAADFLGRTDLGRLVEGAAADLVLCDLNAPGLRGTHDPLRGLVHAAGQAAVRDVFVAGRQVVSGGQALTIDTEAAARALSATRERLAAAVPRHDPEGASLDTLAPLMLKLLD